MAAPELQVYHDLVVPGTACMNLLACVTEPAHEVMLYRCMDIFFFPLDDQPLAGKILEGGHEVLRLVGSEYSRLFQGPGMGHGGHAFIGKKHRIEKIIFSHGKSLNHRLHLLSLVPELHRSAFLFFIIALCAISRIALILINPSESFWLKPPSMFMLESSLL